MELPDYGVDKYDIGTAFGHFGIAVDDVSHCFTVIFCFLSMQYSFYDNFVLSCGYYFCRLF